METFSALLALCKGIKLGTAGFSHKISVLPKFQVVLTPRTYDELTCQLLTHLALALAAISVTKLAHHWLKRRFVAWPAPSYYLNQ